MLILDKVAVGDLFIKNGVVVGCIEEPMKDSESIALTTPDNKTVVVTKKELQEDYSFFQQGISSVLEWCLL